MQSLKLTFSHDVVYLIQSLGATIFNANSEEKLEKIFGVTGAQLEFIIEKIARALPDKIFTKPYLYSLEEVKNIFAREFIFFQVQEKWNDPQYQKNLDDFIHIFSRDIEKRVEHVAI